MSSTEHTFDISEEVVFIYSWIVYGALCQTISLFGVVTNIINIICFVKQGFKDSVNISLLGLSVSDLGSLVTVLWTSACLTPGLMTADLSFDPIEVAYLTTAMPHFAFNRASSCITAMITMERCVCILAPFKIKSIVTPTRVAVVTTSIFVISIFITTPVYVVRRLDLKFSLTRNKTILGLVSTNDRDRVEKITFAITNFVIPFCAFLIIVICTTILSIKLHSTTKWRMKVANQSEIDTVSSRNQKTAKMVVIICALFIVCFVPISISMLALGLIPELSVNGKYMNVSILFGGLSFVLESVNASMNIFIYYQMSSKYRDTCKMVIFLK